MSPLDRRRFIRLATGAAAGAAAHPLVGRLPSGSRPLLAASFQGAPPATGFHRFRLGEIQVTALDDGRYALPADWFAVDVKPEERDRFYAARYLPLDAIPVQACPVLLDTGSARILVDTGMGGPSDFAPEAGRLWSALESAGLTAEEIDLVVLTHAHLDHFGGLLDPVTGGPRFPNAEVVVSRPELEFWTSPEAASRMGEWTAAFGGPEAFVQMGVDVLNGLGDRLRPIEPDGEIGAGIHAVGSPGHTPGHICVLAESGGEQLLLAADAILSIHVSFERPRWPLMVDLDREEAADTRIRLLDRAAADRLLVMGFHFPFPGVGRVAREGGAYRWVPEIRA